MKNNKKNIKCEKQWKESIKTKNNEKNQPPPMKKEKEIINKFQ